MTVTVNGKNFCSQKLKMRILATFDFNRTTTIDILRNVFEDRNISRRTDVLWPLQSCDLTPLDYHFWQAVTNKFYADKPETIDALKVNTRKAIGELQLHTNDNELET